jgi:prepilin-type N-terminal cleavage/methylation domain-containing protein
MRRNSNHLQRRGFTLLELLVVLAIVSVLSTTAIAMFRTNKMRSMRAEAMTNLGAIAKLEKSYYGENGVFPAALPVPLLPPGEKQNWDAAAVAEFGTIGFATEGAVYFVYDVNSPASGGCACAGNACFTASAYGNSDKDPTLAVVGYFHPDEVGGTCTTQLFFEPPPIDVDDGLPILDQPIDIHLAQLRAGMATTVDDY